MYVVERKRYTVKWNPSDDVAAHEAMKEVVDGYDRENTPYELDDSTVTEVQERYSELREENNE